MEDLTIYEEMLAQARSGNPVALATVVESSGSAPRKAGAKMLVRPDGSTLGTVGGGRVELETMAAALAALKSGQPSLIPIPLVPDNGHVCGGRITIYVEPVLPPARLLVVGAGHVGRALATAARFAGFRVTVTDDRPDFATAAQVPDADVIHPGAYAALPGPLTVDAGTFVVIATAGFEGDFTAVRALLRTPARYIGVIGSKRKRETLMQTLLAEGYTPEALSRLTIPVGLPIAAETPEEIAVSIVSQLIRERRSRDAESVGAPAGSRPLAADGAQQAAAPAP